MKFIKFFLFSFAFYALVSCGRKNINDVEAGTPTSADSALAPSKHEPFQPKQLEAYKEAVPKVYKR